MEIVEKNEEKTARKVNPEEKAGKSIFWSSKNKIQLFPE